MRSTPPSRAGRATTACRGGASLTISGYRITEVVQHAKFGQGTVERAEKDFVTVLFPEVGYKTLLASAVTRVAKIA